MLPTKIIILRCIFILHLSGTSGFVFKLNENKEEKNEANLFKGTQINQRSLKDSKVRGLKLKSPDYEKEFENKILIKRIVPHGYKDSGNLYDEKMHTLYKPLVRVQKIKHKENRLKKRTTDEIEKYIHMIMMLDDAQKNTQNIGPNILNAQNSELHAHNYTTNDMLDVIENNYVASRKDKNLKKKGNSNIRILNLSYGPTLPFQTALAKKGRSRNENILRDTESSVETGRRDISSAFDTFKSNLKQIFNLKQNKKKRTSTDAKKKKPHFGYKLNDSKHLRFDVPNRNDRIRQTIQIRIRNLINDKPTIDYLYRNSEPNRKMAGDHKRYLAWFVPVGHTIKQSMADKLRDGKNSLEEQLDWNGLSLKDISDMKYGEKLRSFYKSNEEPDPLSPKDLYYEYEGPSTTKKPKQLTPHYPFWNYWTYDKTLYQDECKGNLVKVGELCVALPPSK